MFVHLFVMVLAYMLPGNQTFFTAVIIHVLVGELAGSREGGCCSAYKGVAMLIPGFCFMARVLVNGLCISFECRTNRGHIPLLCCFHKPTYLAAVLPEIAFSAESHG